MLTLTLKGFSDHLLVWWVSWGSFLRRGLGSGLGGGHFWKKFFVGFWSRKKLAGYFRNESWNELVSSAARSKCLAPCGEGDNPAARWIHTCAPRPLCFLSYFSAVFCQFWWSEISRIFTKACQDIKLTRSSFKTEKFQLQVLQNCKRWDPPRARKSFYPPKRANIPRCRGPTEFKLRQMNFSTFFGWNNSKNGKNRPAERQ